MLTVGLMMALYLSHIRIWGVVAVNPKGQSVLLLGGQPSKYRENFERKFHELTDKVGADLAYVAEETGEEATAA